MEKNKDMLTLLLNGRTCNWGVELWVYSNSEKNKL